MRILICDDSSLARKQLARALPEGLSTDISFAANGEEALEAIRSGPFDLLFLDLTMPVLDGYETLRRLGEEQLMLDVVVVSGDIQSEAQRRVKELGARAFIKKPCDPDSLQAVLPAAALKATALTTASAATAESESIRNINVSELERIEEIANVAMGRAASLLAEVLHVFVVLPLPVVNEVESGDLQMAVHAIHDAEQSCAAVCQGFIGSGISGEAFLMLHDTSIKDLAALLHYPATDAESQIETLMDIANILISASLKGFEEQLDIHFSQGHPTVLGQQQELDELLTQGRENWKKTLAIEFDYSIEAQDIGCTLLLLFSEEAIPKLHQRTAYLA